MLLFWLLLMCFAWQVQPLRCLVHADPAMLTVPQMGHLSLCCIIGGALNQSDCFIWGTASIATPKKRSSLVASLVETFWLLIECTALQHYQCSTVIVVP
jgi:hypothetical protein